MELLNAERCADDTYRRSRIDVTEQPDCGTGSKLNDACIHNDISQSVSRRPEKVRVIDIRRIDALAITNAGSYSIGQPKMRHDKVSSCNRDGIGVGRPIPAGGGVGNDVVHGNGGEGRAGIEDSSGIGRIDHERSKYRRYGCGGWGDSNGDGYGNGGCGAILNG